MQKYVIKKHDNSITSKPLCKKWEEHKSLSSPKLRKLRNIYPSNIVYFHTLNNSRDSYFRNLILETVQLHCTTSLRFDPIDNFFGKSGRPIKLPWRNRSIIVRIHGREPRRWSFCDSKLPRIRNNSFFNLFFHLSIIFT